MKRIIKHIKEADKLIRNSLIGYIVVFIMIQIILINVMKPIIAKMFQFAISRANLMSVTNENIINVVKNPFAILIILATVLVITVFFIIELSILINYMEKCMFGKKITMKTILKPLKKLGGKQFVPFLLYAFLLMPNANLGLTSMITDGISIPTFIMDFINGMTLLRIVYIIFKVIAFYFNIRLIFTLVIFLAQEKTSFIDSLKESFKLTKKHSLKIFLIIGITILVSVAIMSVIIFLCANIVNLMKTNNIAGLHLVSSIAQTITLFIEYATGIFMTIAIIYSIVKLYYKYSDKNTKVTICKNKNNKILCIVLIILFAVTTLFFYFDTPISIDRDTLIISHRGESEKAIENTIEALKLAAEDKPDYIEIDIQESKDKELVVFHDYTLKRLTGINKKVDQLTLEEVKKLTIKQSDKESKISSFEEFIIEAKNISQPLLIEMKSKGKNSESFVDNMMDILIKYDYIDKVIFQSIELNTILKLKEKYPNTYVGYIIGLNIGSLEYIGIDFYSIEDSSLTKTVMKKAKEYNKKLFIWTTNTEEEINDCFKKDVGGIITDFPKEARKLKEDLHVHMFYISDEQWNFHMYE